MPLKICFVASEIAPLAKTGGLADVAGVLPQPPARVGSRCAVFMPLYSSMSNGVLRDAPPVDAAHDVLLALGAHRYSFTILESRLPNSAVPLYLMHCPEVYDRLINLYVGDPTSICVFWCCKERRARPASAYSSRRTSCIVMTGTRRSCR